MGLGVLQRRKILNLGFEKSEVLWVGEAERFILRRYNTKEHVAKACREVVNAWSMVSYACLPFPSPSCQLPLSD